jgi:hypothetical protein
MRGEIQFMNFAFATQRPRLISFGLMCFVTLAGSTLVQAKPDRNQTVTLRVGRQATLKSEGLRIKFVEVAEDSRCPVNVTCVWAGNAKVQIEIRSGHGDSQTLTLNTAGSATLPSETQYPYYQLRLVNLSPRPRSNRKIAAHDYTLTLLLSRIPIPDRAQQQPRVTAIDRLRLSEAFRIGETLGNQLWPGWNKAPFAVLLVAPDYEFLIRHPKPSADFKLINYDPRLRSDVYYRERTQPKNLLATFPVVGGIPTIVIGQAENTDKQTSSAWVVTVLHEHFHQLQYSRPGYYQAVASLDLSRGDQSGMWMLNYPFPYDWQELEDHFALLRKLLADALEANAGPAFQDKLSAYLKQRTELGQTLSPDDYRYFSFQLWQEGIARYTEYRIATLAATKYLPGKAFRGLKDYQPFAAVAAQVKSGIANELRNGKLEHDRRVMFYALGAGEGLLLDRAQPRWRERYFSDLFYLDKYFSQPR